MKCPNCEKQNKPGVKKCEYCNEVMPVRKKRETLKKEEVAKETKTITKDIKNNKMTKKTKNVETKKDVVEKNKKAPVWTNPIQTQKLEFSAS